MWGQKPLSVLRTAEISLGELLASSPESVITVRMRGKHPRCLIDRARQLDRDRINSDLAATQLIAAIHRQP